jgi:hypothetical protein
MQTLILAIALSYTAIGFFLAIVFLFVFRRRYFGNMTGAVIAGVLGAFVGGLFDYFFSDIIEQLSAIGGYLNIFPPIITAAITLSIFAAVSERKDTYD